MAASGKQSKIMSSRLAGMKFMQRTGASPATPSTPSTPAGPPSKKQRLSNGGAIASPVSGPVDSSDETKWYLSFRAPQLHPAASPLRVVSAGFSTLDARGRDEVSSEEEETEAPRPQMPGRKSFGKFNKKLEKQQNPQLSSSPSGSESSADDDDGSTEDADDDDPTGVNALIAQGRKDASERARAERKEKKKAALVEAQKLAEQRRKREVNLNKVTSISNGGGSGGGAGNLANMTCHGCGEKGHRQADCPQKRSGRRKPH
jgi:hypothetical protein